MAPTLTIDRLEADNELYCQYQTQCTPQPVRLSLDLEDGRLRAYYWSEIGNGFLMSSHCGLDVEWSIPPLTIQGFDNIVEQIEEDLKTILKGSEILHDGSNYVGRLTEEAQDARDRVEEAIERFKWNNSHDDGNIYMLWQAGDWLIDFDPTTVITSKSTDFEIEKIAEEMTEEAKDDGYDVEGIEEYLIRARNELEEEEEDNEDE